jgi:hypothetical protein
MSVCGKAGVTGKEHPPYSLDRELIELLYEPRLFAAIQDC